MAKIVKQLMNLVNGTPKPNGVRCSLAEDGKSADLHIYDAIFDASWHPDVFGAKDLLAFLADNPDVEEINVYLNSPGGSIATGLTIFNQLKNHSALVHTFVDGMACSIASVIAMAGDEITMNSGSVMMVHNPWSCVCGSAADMQSEADLLVRWRDELLKIYSARGGQDTDTLREQMDAAGLDGIWMFGDEAVDAGFADNTRENAVAVASFGCAFNTADVPEKYRDAVGKMLPAEPPKAEAKPVETPSEETPRADLLETFVDQFGPVNGLAWWKEKKTHAEALTLHNGELAQENKALQTRLDQVGEGEETALSGDDPDGDSQPANDTAAFGHLGEAAGFAGGLKEKLAKL
ncbi:MAG: hypothetical protein HN420_09965 [Rhodospirillaceae bacterium]|nr:hypothetical protein [Rhodospirillaceae bacterium]